MPELATPPAETSAKGSASLLMNAFIDTQTDSPQDIAQVTPPVTTDKEPPKPADKPTPPPKPPEAKPRVESKPEPKAEAPKADPFANAPKQLRERLQQLEGELGKTKTEKQAEIDRLNARVREYENKPSLTPEMEKKMQAAEERASKLEAELYANDYRQSPEFKSQFEGRWNKAYKDATDEVSGLTVKFMDGEENKERPAVKQDFDRILALPYAEQSRAARLAFGEDSSVVLTHRNNLRGIETSAEEAIASRKADFDKKKSEFVRGQEETTKNFNRTYQDSDREIVAAHPKFFGDDPDDPKSNEQYQKGLTFVDESASGNFTPEERASRAAIVRRWAAHFPRAVHRINVLEAKLAEKDAEIDKFRGSSPGSIEPGQGGKGAGGDEKLNTAKLAEMFDK